MKTIIKTHIMKNSRIPLLYLSVLLLLMCCEDFIDIEAPKTELTGAVVFTDVHTAEAALTGIYSQMTEGFGGFANYKTTLLAGLYADELDDYTASASQLEFYENAINPNNGDLLNLWNEPYNYIYQANAIIDGLMQMESVPDDTKNQLIGEALFIRAFCHFYLVNFFGDVPYVRTTNYLKNTVAERQPVSEVYEHIINDLNEAASLLVASYASDGRVRPNTHTAKALLARVYLYTGDWLKAEQASHTVIEVPEYQLETDLNAVFLASSSEAIWQLYPVITGLNTVEGFSLLFFSLPYNVALRSEVVNSLETGDLRRNSWIGSTTSGANTFYYPKKYKVFFSSTLTEYYMVLRLAEQYLIRAESRVHLNDLEGALSDVNTVRNRAGLEDISNTSNNIVLEAIYKERQRELFAEWGHRWFDLKRTDRAHQALAPIKNGWQPTDVLFPIPQAELLNNPNMRQNPGY